MSAVARFRKYGELHLREARWLASKGQTRRPGFDPSLRRPGSRGRSLRRALKEARFWFTVAARLVRTDGDKVAAL